MLFRPVLSVLLYCPVGMALKVPVITFFVTSIDVISAFPFFAILSFNNFNARLPLDELPDNSVYIELFI